MKARWLYVTVFDILQSHMLIFEIAFVLVNLAVPYWIWTRKSLTTLPPIQSEPFNVTVFKMVLGAGGFDGCDAQSVVETIDDLCDRSRDKYNDQQSTRIEQAGIGVVFSCEYRKTEILVQFSPENTSSDLKCRPIFPARVARAPTFRIKPDGELTAIDYWNDMGVRRVLPIRACDKKLRLAEHLSHPPRSLDGFLTKLGVPRQDPHDGLTFNRMCYYYGLSDGWADWRKRYE